MTNHIRFAAHAFGDLENATFSPEIYSRLKFGCDRAARSMGHDLAKKFFAAHSDQIIANRIVVIPSPYNHVPNAATVMTGHFVNKLNELSVHASGRHVEYSIIHRKVSYTNDYGFLSKEKRRSLIDNDSFYMNRDFLEGKLLVFIDDVRITGTHEDKLREILERDNVQNDAAFLYFAEYYGNQPDIEGALNFSHVKSLDDYVAMTHEEDHHVIVRPLKYLLGQKSEDLRRVCTQFPISTLEKVYHGCLAEGYYKIPGYQSNFGVIVDVYNQRTR